MSDPQQAAGVPQAAERVVEGGLLDQIVEEGRLARDVAARERGKDMVKEFVSQVLQGEMTVSRDTEAMINARIAQIDHLLSIQLNEVMHHPSFQKLEGSWRGLRYLMDQSETSVMLKIRVLNVNKKELLRDLQRAPEFDQSAAFKKIYEEEFGVFGGEPIGAVIGDFEFGRTPEDIELLEKIAANSFPRPALEEHVVGHDDRTASADLQDRMDVLNEVELLVAGRGPEVLALVGVVLLL